MKRIIALLPLLLAAALPGAHAQQAKPNTLTPQQISDGWLLLFDGETTFGWKTTGDVKVADGILSAGGQNPTTLAPTTEFSDYEMTLDFRTEGAQPVGVTITCRDDQGESAVPPTAGQWVSATLRVVKGQLTADIKLPNGQGAHQEGTFDVPGRVALTFNVPAGSRIDLRNVKLKPLNLVSIFNGKDLTGWKEIPGHKSVYTVNDKGELNVKNGNGDLQSEGQWADFVLQLDIISNGDHLNSGVFYRCIPGQFWSGYESQIRNQWEGDDRAKPVDYGTGGIYNRQPARRVVSSDREWFTKTVVAHGAHMAVWINGTQVSDFTDTRQPNNSGRNGLKLEAGPISLQGHDPTTDLSFRNIRVGEMPK